jgi:NADH dehydrogenase
MTTPSPELPDWDLKTVQDETDLHRIVIVGGGAGGLELATTLGNKLGARKGRQGKAHITLIEKTRTHFWKPHLHEIAAGSMDTGAYETDYLAQAYRHHFRYRIGEVVGLDRERREVLVAPYIDEDGEQVTPPRRFSYDTLIMAVGSQTNDFGTPGAADYAIALDTTAQAQRFHRRLVNSFLRAHAQAEPIRTAQLDVAIIGAGATGVELAAQLHNTTRSLVSYGFDRINPEEDIKLILIEAADRILPGLPPRLSEGAHMLLQKLGISVRTGSKVAEVLPQGVKLASG